ncbi:hypothetical protein [Chengkuizengella sediminis]|uniref:hypothetical protein n=1 Tax=Chengkuizengella sediminis TaxID=1885917 RepID=UPI0013897720|nr:hypothetical protein [Chengkuizengella sediminis]NDI35653.1 hypothetical protein [Chengkuizengella sediminis]
MGLKKGPFVVADTVSVDGDPYSSTTKGVIELGPSPEIVATVDVCVTEPQKTQVSLDSMAQIAVIDRNTVGNPITFEVKYEILRNDTVIATINDKMDYETIGDPSRHTNFPSFPVLDNHPGVGMNRYELRVARIETPEVGSIFVASRSLKATVFTV